MKSIPKILISLLLLLSLSSHSSVAQSVEPEGKRLYGLRANPFITLFQVLPVSTIQTIGNPPVTKNAFVIYQLPPTAALVTQMAKGHRNVFELTSLTFGKTGNYATNFRIAGRYGQDLLLFPGKLHAARLKPYVHSF